MDNTFWTVATIIVIGLVGTTSIAAVTVNRHRQRRSTDADLAAARLTYQQAKNDAATRLEQARTEALALREASLEDLAQRNLTNDELLTLLDTQERELSEQRRVMDERRDALQEHQAQIDEIHASVDVMQGAITEKLLEKSGLDQTTAASLVLERTNNELLAEHSARVTRALEVATPDSAFNVRETMTQAIERQQSSHADTAPRPMPISLEGMEETDRDALLKTLTAVSENTATEVTVDAESQHVVLRGLDPVGREVARQVGLEASMRRLEVAQVSPLVVQTRSRLQRRIAELGERAMWEAQLDGRPELAELLGTLHYRFSYGQNALLHCQEAGYLCATLAGELHMDTGIARIAGLLHDIGKAVDHDVEGSHATIGGEMLTVLGVPETVVHAVKAHHFDEEPSTNLALLTICADAISASRPGARRDTLTTYLARLEQLQTIATRHHGVERAFPMQAGREVRVAVVPGVVADVDVPILCAEIAREIESEMNYPGMIKVTVIRETVATATAA